MSKLGLEAKINSLGVQFLVNSQPSLKRLDLGWSTLK